MGTTFNATAFFLFCQLFANSPITHRRSNMFPQLQADQYQTHSAKSNTQPLIHHPPSQYLTLLCVDITYFTRSCVTHERILQLFECLGCDIERMTSEWARRFSHNHVILSVRRFCQFPNDRHRRAHWQKPFRFPDAQRLIATIHRSHTSVNARIDIKHSDDSRLRSR